MFPELAVILTLPPLVEVIVLPKESIEEAVTVVSDLIFALAKEFPTLEILPTLIFTSPDLLMIEPLFVRFAVGEFIVKSPFANIVEPVAKELFPRVVELIPDVIFARDVELFKSATVALVPSNLFLVSRLK